MEDDFKELGYKTIIWDKNSGHLIEIDGIKFRLPVIGTKNPGELVHLEIPKGEKTNEN